MSDTSTIPKMQVARPTEQKNKHHDIGRFFGSMKPAYLFLVIVGGNLLFVAIGAFIGYQRYLQKITIPEAPLETATGAVLGFSAFMLAFTFSTTWGRFAARNELLINHAKAITACWLRAGLIPERQKIQTRKLLHEYTTTLLEIKTDDLDRSLEKIDHIHMSIWEQTESLVPEDMDSELRSLFTGSVNDLISVAAERKARTLFLRIPDAIWGSLLSLSIVGMFAFGYQAGIGGMGRLLHLPLLPIAFGIVIVLIADLNSPHSQRHFRVTRKPLIGVLETMEKEIQ